MEWNTWNLEFEILNFLDMNKLDKQFEEMMKDGVKVEVALDEQYKKWRHVVEKMD